MSIIRIFILMISFFYFTQCVADIPFETLRTCVDQKPRLSSIQLIELEGEGTTKMNESDCRYQYLFNDDGYHYGMEMCQGVFYLVINDKKLRADSAVNRSVNSEIKPGNPLTSSTLWAKIIQKDQSYLCIMAPLTESGQGAGLSQYYIVENAFDPNKKPILYYYFFEKGIMPVTSPNF